MEIMAAGMMALFTSGPNRPWLMPMAARMKENSPIWPRATATDRLRRRGFRNRVVMSSAASGLTTMMMPRVASIRGQSLSRAAGSKSMPTETKKSTAKASRRGRASAAARAASWKSAPPFPVFCQAHIMDLEALTTAPQPFRSKAYCTSSAVPPWAP